MITLSVSDANIKSFTLSKWFALNKLLITKASQVTAPVISVMQFALFGETQLSRV